MLGRSPDTCTWIGSEVSGTVEASDANVSETVGGTVYEIGGVGIAACLVL